MSLEGNERNELVVDPIPEDPMEPLFQLEDYLIEHEENIFGTVGRQCSNLTPKGTKAIKNLCNSTLDVIHHQTYISDHSYIQVDVLAKLVGLILHHLDNEIME